MKKIGILMPMTLLSFLLFSHVAQAVDYTNSLGMKFKNIPAGSFYMGSCKYKAPCPSGAKSDSDSSDKEKPQHKVHISKKFQIGVYEVTLGQFKKFIVGAGRNDLLTDQFIERNSHGDDAPVTGVSWYDAQAFIRWLNKQERRNVYRLPTEAEWEYVARAGTTTLYSWGDSQEQVDDYAWYETNTYGVEQEYAHAVGGKRPNPWGLYDMHGNVFEWVEDWYAKDYYSKSHAHDPKGPSSGEYRVYRGGCWFNEMEYLRSAFRGYGKPSSRNSGVGFRLVRQP